MLCSGWMSTQWHGRAAAFTPLCPRKMPQAEQGQELREDRQRILCFWQGSNSCSYRQFGEENHYLPQGEIRLSKSAESSSLLKRPEEEGVAVPAEHKQRGISVFLQFLSFCDFCLPAYMCQCSPILFLQLWVSPNYEQSFWGKIKVWKLLFKM